MGCYETKQWSAGAVSWVVTVWDIQRQPCAASPAPGGELSTEAHLWSILFGSGPKRKHVNVWVEAVEELLEKDEHLQSVQQKASIRNAHANFIINKCTRKFFSLEGFDTEKFIYMYFVYDF